MQALTPTRSNLSRSAFLLSFLRSNWWIALLLVVGAAHCTQAIFFDNYSYLDLVHYEQGHERMPFQGRVAMALILKAAHGSPWLTSYAHGLTQDVGIAHLIIEPYTAEKLISFWAGLVSMLVIVATCSWYGVKYSFKMWWACPALALAIFYASYAAHSGSNNVWYPYDLPHAALFTLALLALIEGHWALMMCLFFIDLPVRETSIYLAPCLLMVGWVEKRMSLAIKLALIMTVAAIALRVAVIHAFHGSPSEAGIPFRPNYHSLTAPKTWPQIASLFGFLGLPLVLNWRRLTPPQRAVLLGAAPCVFLSALMGIWQETRVFSEWNALVSCLAFSVFSRFIAQGESSSGTSASWSEGGYREEVALEARVSSRAS